MGDTRCPYFETCPICGASGEVKLLWILSYCKTERFAACERHKTRAIGATPAFTLLPDGTHMAADTEQLVRAHVEATQLAHLT